MQGPRSHTYTRPLLEAELLNHLCAHDTVVIKMPGIRWQVIERQIERLGFGDEFIVSAMTGHHGASCKIEASNRLIHASPRAA